MTKSPESRNIAIIYSACNRKGYHDATGAFIPEAQKFQKIHGVPDKNMFGFNFREKASIRRKKVLEHIYCTGRNEYLDGIAFFCHGWSNGIQAGFTKSHIGDLVKVINGVSRDYLEIVLYACSTAENSVKDNEIKNISFATFGGFADTLAQSLGRMGILGHVDAHKKAGHTTWVPYVVRFINSGYQSRATWLVEPRSESWSRWIRSLRETDMRLRFPFMSELQIKNELQVVYK